MKAVKRIITVLLMILFIFLLLSLLELYKYKKEETFPKVAIVKETSNMIKYYSLVYKIYYCKSDNSSILVDYFDKETVCKDNFEYNNDSYINLVNTSISKKDILLLTYENIYTKDMIDVMNNEEVENAKYVVNEYLQMKYKKMNISSTSDEYIIFPKVIYNDEKYELIYNEEIIYCFDEKELKYSVYDGKCDTYKLLKYSDKFCKLYKSSTLVYGNKINKSMCN